MTKVKICGLTTPNDIDIINSLAVDYIGMVMYFPKSKRNISPDKAKKLIPLIRENIKKTAVVVKPTVEQIQEITSCGFDIIQIHGEITADVIQTAKLPIFKAFNVNDIDKINYYNSIEKICGYVFDASQPGSGKTFDWESLKHVPNINKPVILAGGLNPSNVKFAIDCVHPYAVDVSSGVENDNGAGKNYAKIREFISVAKNLPID